MNKIEDEDLRTLEAELDEVREIDEAIRALLPKLRTQATELAKLEEQVAYAMTSVENTRGELRKLAAAQREKHAYIREHLSSALDDGALSSTSGIYPTVDPWPTALPGSPVRRVYTHEPPQPEKQ